MASLLKMLPETWQPQEVLINSPEYRKDGLI